MSVETFDVKSELVTVTPAAVPAVQVQLVVLLEVVAAARASALGSLSIHAMYHLPVCEECQNNAADKHEIK